MYTDVYEVLVRIIYAQQVFCMADQEVYGVRHGFGRSKCLADEGRNLLGALSCIESVDSKSHEVKH